MGKQAEIEPMLVDPLRASSELPYRIVVYPHGFPLEISTNSRAVVQAAKESWSKFSKEFDVQPVRLGIGVSEEAGDQALSPPVFRSRGHLLSAVSSPEDFIVCDLGQGFGYGWMTEAALADAGFFRYYFLDAAALVMIDHRYLAPVHAGLIERNGRGVLLCGESFAGKSTLTYACVRTGWTLICDDGTYLVRDRDDRFGIGNPHALRFREDAKLLFPELKSFLVATRTNGKVGMEVMTNELPGISKKTGCVIDHVVFLNRRNGGPARLVRFPKSEALERIDTTATFGLEEACEERKRCYQRLLAAEVWQLNYGDLDRAIAELDTLVERGE